MMRGDKVIVADEEDGRTNPTRNLRNASESYRNHFRIFKTSTLLFGIFALLYLTEIVEIRKPFGGSLSSNDVGTKVEFKNQNPKPVPVSPNENVVDNDNENEWENQESVNKSVQNETNPSDEHSTGKNMAINGGSISFNKQQKVESVESVVFPKISENTASVTNTMTHRHMYTRRGQPMSKDDEKSMIEKWGSWTLVDNKERPTGDYYVAYPNRDIPRSEFPPNAWQIDNEYLGDFLPEAIKLIERTQDAILAEYGHTEGSWEERTEMFELEMFESLEKASGYIIQKPEWRKDEEGERGGWSTFKSMEGLKRRLLHAIMTEDTFILAMGGHSSAAGHGNNFIQSYTVQVQWILEAIFSRLGVRHISKNFGNGGLGTIQHGLAASSIYGPSIDMLIWDSAMTEKESRDLDTFARQALIGGQKVPVLWGLLGKVAKELNLKADVDVGGRGRGTFGIKQASNLTDIDDMPWASRYVKCGGEINDICKDHKYTARCWDDNRSDIIPVTRQEKFPKGRAKWHPGSRRHQAIGRVLAFTLLNALKEGLKEWNEAAGYNIADNVWHVTAQYENIRAKLEELGPDFGWCKEQEMHELGWVCKYPVKARTEFTPRAHPAISNIRSLMQPEMAALVPTSDRPLYEPPELFNADLHPPPGAIDVLNIVEAGVDFKSTLNPDYANHYYKAPNFAKRSKIPFGRGVGISTIAGDEYCDGSVDSFCGKGPNDTCLLAGTNDSRNGLVMDGYSGWTVLNIPDLKFGYIALKLDTSKPSNSNPMTEGWTSENNENKRTQNKEVVLKDDPQPEYCDEFKFEYAIDGVIKSLNKDEFLGRIHQVQRVVETITILKDQNYTGGVEKEVEIGLRLTGCGRLKTFHLSHVYWS